MVRRDGFNVEIKKGAKVKGEPPSWDSSGSKSSSIPPLIIVEGFLSAAQSLVWGDEFKGFMELGEQSFLDQAGAFNDPYGEKLEGEQAWGRGDRLDDDGSVGDDESSTEVGSCCETIVDPHPGETRKGGKVDQEARRGKREIYFAPIGPVSSLHDRACELFYALRGGTVDYGLSHSQEHGHSRYGRHYEEPLCPTWSRHGLPAHFIGHSLGGPTILKLQQLLRKGFFDQALGYERPFAASEGEDGAGEGANEGWRPSDLILSVTSVSSPFRGTPLVYSLGSEPLPYPKVRFLSVGDLLAKAVHLAAFLDLPFFDTHADAWPFARPRTALKAAAESKDEEEAIGCGKHAAFIEASPREGFIGLLRQLWRSDWAEGRDCAPWDCTLFEREKDSQEDDWGLELIEDDDNPEADYSGIMRRRNPRTWYRSYAGYMTRLESAATRDPESLPMHEPTSGWGLSPFILTARLLGSFNFDRVEPSPGFWSAFKQEERGGAAAFPGPSMRAKVESWYCNDGVVPLASQFHPGDCHPSKCRHSTGMPGPASSSPCSGEKRGAARPSRLEMERQSLQEDLIPSYDEAMRRNDKDSWRLVNLAARLTASALRASKTALGYRVEPDSARFPVTSRFSPRQTPRPAPPSSVGSLDDLLLGSVQASDDGRDEVEDKEMNEDEEQEETLIKWVDILNEDDDQLPPNKLGWTSGSLVERPKPNFWHTFILPDTSHASLCPFWAGSDQQKEFWIGMGYWLAQVDRAHFELFGVGGR